MNNGKNSGIYCNNRRDSRPKYWTQKQKMMKNTH